MLLHELFAAAAAAHPDHIAIDVPRGASLTYAQVDALSESLAGQLAVAPDDIVALRLPRCDERIYIAMLAVLRAGAAYTCLDPAWPDHRADAVLDDARPVLLLDGAAYGTLAAGRGGGRRAQGLQDHHLAYVIYTSGTTGRPKGVMIEHRSVVNLALADRTCFGLGVGDRVAQCSSTAYDSSVEEIWLAWSCGATLVPLDDETLRSGPDLGAWLREQRISVLGPPPTLLRMGLCDDPERDLPDLRLLYVGGEALTDDVVQRWAPGRWLENGYGPTEACVVALRTRIFPGHPVTIGRPIAGMRAVVLGPDLGELGPGHEGELCLGGVGLARGYLGDAALTAQRFIEHPDHGRLYRSGDLVVAQPDGNYRFLGRIDRQVKLRGHRVELTDIEANLCQLPGVVDAGCVVQQQVLHAFVVGTGFDAEGLRASLTARLPAHCVPGGFHQIDAIPRQAVSGKIDQRALGALIPPSAAVGEVWRPTPESVHTPVGRVAQTLCSVLHADGVDLDGDFFLDLGGDSVRAAQWVSTLRREAGFGSVSVRDLYRLRTARALAAEMFTETVPARHEPTSTASLGAPVRFTLAQAGVLLCGVHVAAVTGWLLGFLLLPWLLERLPLLILLVSIPVALAVVAPLWAALSVSVTAAAKWALLGRYEPGRHPAWGWWHFRHWWVSGIASLVPWAAVQGTVFLNGMLRVLGAQVGRRVHLDRGVAGLGSGWDLLRLGDDVSVGRDAALRTVDLDAGYFVLGEVVVGDGASLDTRAGLGPTASLGAGAHLEPLAVVPSGSSLPALARAAGVPAQTVGSMPPGDRGPHEPATSPPVDPRQVTEGFDPVVHGLLTLLARSGLRWIAAAPWWAVLVGAVLLFDVDSDRVLSWLFAPHAWDLEVGLGLALGVVALGPISLLWSACLCRAMPTVTAGIVGRWTLRYLLVEAKIGAVEAAGRTLSGTMFWPAWLRLAGMRVGRGCEISTISGAVPELCSFGEHVFFADGIYLGAPSCRQSLVQVGHTRLGPETFVGNHSVLPPGTSLDGGVLLGVCTVADERMTQGTSWFGNPAFALPRREIVEMDRSLTHEPGAAQVLSRLFWECLRFLLPLWPLGAVLVWFKLMDQVERATGSPVLFFGVVLPVWLLATAALSLGWVWLLKWTLLGRVRPGQHGLWSCWASRWDFVYVAWQRWAAPVARVLEGSLLIAPWLRAMGVHVGKLCLLGRGFAQVVDPDMIHLHDGATVACAFQAHSFEDRVLKIAPVHLGAHSTVAAGAVVMYGARVREGAHVGHHSVIMKEEEIVGRVLGAPTRPVMRG